MDQGTAQMTADVPAAPAQPVWTGDRWIAGGLYWDGATWAPSRPAPPVYATAPGPFVAPPKPAPTRAAVFGHVYWRTLVVSVGGGGVVAGLFATVAMLVDARGFGRSGVGVVAVAVLVGLFMGVLLGVVAGFVTGGLAAAALVPYRGAATTRGVMVAAALVIVAAFSIWLMAGATHKDTSAYLYDLVIVVPSLIGAALGGWWLVRWYVKRMAALTPAG